MKKILVLVAVVGMLSTTALAGFIGNDETKPGPLSVTGATVNWSDVGVWKQNLTADTTILPWTGTRELVAGSGNTYKSEITISQYGVTVNSDAGTNLGDGTIVGYTTSGAAVLNTAGKLNVKNGTFNLNGQTLWVDKLQNGTVARTASGTAGGVVYVGRSVMNIGTDGALRVTGTEAVGAAGGNMALGCYGVNIDSYVKVSGNGILSGVTRVGGVAVGGRTMELSRNGNYQNDVMNVEINGSSATVEAWSLKMNGNGTLISNLKWVTDTGGASAINLYGAGANVVTFGTNNKLDFQLGAAPTTNQVYTLLNLVDGTATQNVAAGRFKRMDGTVLTESMNVFAKYGDQWYTFAVSYKGGTGNDVTLTYVVPEPATLGLLSLGGLLLARRRRA